MTRYRLQLGGVSWGGQYDLETLAVPPGRADTGDSDYACAAGGCSAPAAADRQVCRADRHGALAAT